MKYNILLMCILSALFITACSNGEHTNNNSSSSTSTPDSLETLELKKENEQNKNTNLDGCEKNTQLRLNVPLRIQETEYYCVPACLQMVLAYHDIFMEQSELANRLNTHPTTGTEYEDLAKEASLLIFGSIPKTDIDPGYRAILWKQGEGSQDLFNHFQKRVRTNLESGDPVFISINSAPAYGTEIEIVHEVVLYGADYDSDGTPLMYYFLDPSSSWQDSVYGGQKMFPPDQLWKIMNNNPEPGYVF